MIAIVRHRRKRLSSISKDDFELTVYGIVAACHISIIIDCHTSLSFFVLCALCDVKNAHVYGFGYRLLL